MLMLMHLMIPFYGQETFLILIYLNSFCFQYFCFVSVSLLISLIYILKMCDIEFVLAVFCKMML